MRQPKESGNNHCRAADGQGDVPFHPARDFCDKRRPAGVAQANRLVRSNWRGTAVVAGRLIGQGVDGFQPAITFLVGRQVAVGLHKQHPECAIF